MECAAVLRVKRKRGGSVPADTLVLACKRLRTEQNAAAACKDEVQKNLFKLVATVASENEPVQKYIQEALTKDKGAQLLRPSIASAQRVIQDLRSSKQAIRQESRYRLIARHRPNLSESESAILDANGKELNDSNQLVPGVKEDASPKESCGTSACYGEFQLLDIVQEEDVRKDALQVYTWNQNKRGNVMVGLKDHGIQVLQSVIQQLLKKQGDPDVILCNAVEMIRQRLTVSDSKEAEHSSKEEEGYVYDIYYMETTSPGWIENILSVQPYTQDYELVDEDGVSEEIYEDEDDENNENNWRNDYPDEDEFFPNEDDESENGSISDEDSGYIKRTWEKYQSDVLREFEYDGLQELDSE